MRRVTVARLHSVGEQSAMTDPRPLYETKTIVEHVATRTPQPQLLGAGTTSQDPSTTTDGNAHAGEIGSEAKGTTERIKGDAR